MELRSDLQMPAGAEANIVLRRRIKGRAVPEAGQDPEDENAIYKTS